MAGLTKIVGLDRYQYSVSVSGRYYWYRFVSVSLILKPIPHWYPRRPLLLCNESRRCQRDRSASLTEAARRSRPTTIALPLSPWTVPTRKQRRRVVPLLLLPLVSLSCGFESKLRLPAALHPPCEEGGDCPTVANYCQTVNGCLTTPPTLVMRQCMPWWDGVTDYIIGIYCNSGEQQGFCK